MKQLVITDLDFCQDESCKQSKKIKGSAFAWGSDWDGGWKTSQDEGGAAGAGVAFGFARSGGTTTPALVFTNVQII